MLAMQPFPGRFCRTLERVTRRPAPHVACIVVAFGVAAMTAPVLYAQKGRAEVGEGNRLYAEGRFDEAYEKYLEALRDNPDSPVIRFNEGNALYQTQEFQRALDAYRAAIESGDQELVSKAWYNLGNALYRQQQLEGALEAYKQSLRLDPNDEDAKHNLEMVLQQMQQQQQQQQPPGQEGQQGQEDQQQQQQQEQQQEQQQQQENQGGEQRQQAPEEEEQQQQQQQQPQPGEMSREEAERLLQAIQEDPDRIDRQHKVAAVGRKPKKDW